MHAKATASSDLAKDKHSKSRSKSEGKGKSKENKGKSKRQIHRNQKCEARCQRHTQGENIESWSLRTPKIGGKLGNSGICTDAPLTFLGIVDRCTSHVIFLMHFTRV